MVDFAVIDWLLTSSVSQADVGVSLMPLFMSRTPIKYARGDRNVCPTFSPHPPAWLYPTLVWFGAKRSLLLKTLAKVGGALFCANLFGRRTSDYSDQIKSIILTNRLASFNRLFVLPLVLYSICCLQDDHTKLVNSFSCSLSLSLSLSLGKHKIETLKDAARVTTRKPFA